MNDSPTEVQRTNNAIAVELAHWAESLQDCAEHNYPMAVFRPAKTGESYTNPDGAAAAMARHTLRLVARRLTERASELATEEIP